MTQGQPHHGAEGVRPGRGQAPAAPAPDREAAGRRRAVSLRRPDHRQGHREGRAATRDACKDEQGACASPPPPPWAMRGFERTEALIDAGVDVLVVDTAHGHSEQACSTRSSASSAVQPCRSSPATSPRRRRAGADRRRRRRGQGRHRPGLDLHHAHRRRRRRAAAHRDHGCGRGCAKATLPVIADGGIKFPATSPRRSRRRLLRHGRLAARRHRRERRARCSSTRAAPTRPIAAWARSARWRAARPTATSSRTSRTR
jgi:hypothetical protein